MLVGGGAVALAVASGLAIDVLFEARLARSLDRELEVKARLLATLTEQEGDAVQLEAAGELMPEFRAAEGGEYLQLWLEGGELLARSESLAGGDLPRYSGRSPAPRFRDLALPDGRRGRSVQLDFLPRLEIEDAGGEYALLPDQAPPGVEVRAVSLVLAVSAEDLSAAVGHLRTVVLAVVLALVTGLMLLVRWAVSQGLAPVNQLAERVAAADPASPSVRFAAPDLPLEIAPLAARLDELLARQAGVLERERRFSSNVAHELRTPVAELRGLAEVAERFPDNREAVEEFFSDVAAIAGQMEGLIGGLLALARCESGAEPIDASRVELTELLLHAWSRYQSRAESRRLGLVTRIPRGLAVTTDARKLELVLFNLTANAVAHAPPGSTVELAAEATAQGFRITISNPAPGLGPEDLERVFERFWRKDEARSGGGEHAGLGLTLVQSLCRVLGYSVAPRLRPDGVLEVAISGPLEVAPRTVASP